MIKARIKAMVGSFIWVLTAVSICSSIYMRQDVNLLESRMEEQFQLYENPSTLDSLGVLIIKHLPSSFIYTKLNTCYGFELNRFASNLLILNIDPSSREEVMEQLKEDQIELQQIRQSSNQLIREYAEVTMTFDQLIEAAADHTVSTEVYTRVFEYYNNALAELNQKTKLYQLSNIVLIIVTLEVLTLILVLLYLIFHIYRQVLFEELNETESENKNE